MEERTLCVCYRCIRQCPLRKRCVLLITDNEASGITVIHFKCPAVKGQQSFSIGLDTKPFTESIRAQIK